MICITISSELKSINTCIYTICIFNSINELYVKYDTKIKKLKACRKLRMLEMIEKQFYVDVDDYK